MCASKIRASAFLASLIVLAACGAAALPASLTPDLEARRISEAGDMLDAWHRAAADADEEAYFAHFASEGIFLGTDATERWDVAAFRAYAHPHFERGRAWTFRATRRVVRLAADGQLAYFDEDLHTEGLGPARGSGVLRRDPEGIWKILHYNLTITVPNERFAEVRTLLAAPAPEETAEASPERSEE